MKHPNDLNIFLDSGAFSAWSRKKEIDLDEYCQYIKNNIEFLEVYASLDVIPGTPGRVASTKDREQAAAQSWENYLYMVNEGLDPLPVYHYGEDKKWLHQMLDYGCHYIGIGGLVGITSDKRRLWLDRVFSDITDSDGIPKVKTHGFGMTALPLIFRYPWYSVDSLAWIRVAQNGGVMVPKTKKDGSFRFDTSPTTIFVSEDSPMVNKEGKHYRSMGTSVVRIIMKWLEDCGTNLSEVSSNYHYRALVNASFFKRVAEEKAERPFRHKDIIQGVFF